MIVSQWIADVDAKGMKVVYSGGGSSKGRNDFANNTTDFAITEVPYRASERRTQHKPGRAFAYLPIVAGGTAFTYQIKVGGKLVKNLRLSGETLTKIFANKITNWNDPAITTDNNGIDVAGPADHPGGALRRLGHVGAVHPWMDKEYP